MMQSAVWKPVNDLVPDPVTLSAASGETVSERPSSHSVSPCRSLIQRHQDRIKKWLLVQSGGGGRCSVPDKQGAPSLAKKQKKQWQCPNKREAIYREIKTASSKIDWITTLKYLELFHIRDPGTDICTEGFSSEENMCLLYFQPDSARSKRGHHLVIRLAQVFFVVVKAKRSDWSTYPQPSSAGSFHWVLTYW